MFSSYSYLSTMHKEIYMPEWLWYILVRCFISIRMLTGQMRILNNVVNITQHVLFHWKVEYDLQITRKKLKNYSFIFFNCDETNIRYTGILVFFLFVISSGFHIQCYVFQSPWLTSFYSSFFTLSPAAIYFCRYFSFLLQLLFSDVCNVFCCCFCFLLVFLFCYWSTPSSFPASVFAFHCSHFSVSDTLFCCWYCFLLLKLFTGMNTSPFCCCVWFL